MHATIFNEFDRICRMRNAGGDVLEVGAIPSEDCLLCLPALAHARSKVGINLDPPSAYRDFRILQGNANAMPCFPSDCFDTVVCNSVLEHDRYFWKSIAEIHRVTRPGGLIVIGVPAYHTLAVEGGVRRLAKFLSLVGIPRHLLDPLAASTLTLHNHLYPGDYYRFSPQAVQEVFLDTLVDTDIYTLMVPPRVIGVGVKRRNGTVA